MNKAILIAVILLAGAVAYSTDENSAGDNDPDKCPGWSRKGIEKPGEHQNERPLIRRLLSKLSPEEIEKLRELHEKDPEQFRKELFNKFREREAEREMKHSKSVELAKKYHESKDEAEKARLRDEIKKAVVEEFDSKIKRSRERLEKAEKQLLEFKKSLEEREKNREAIIESRISELLKDPALKW